MTRRKHRVWPPALLLTCGMLYGIYLLFASSLDRTELLAGIGAAIVATIATTTVDLLGIVRFRPALRDLMQAWRIPWYLVEGTYEIFQGLSRQLFTRGGADSVVRAVRFKVGGDDSRSAALRALAVIYTTITPNFIVFGIVRKQRLLLYHQILPGDVLQMTINLGAEP